MQSSVDPSLSPPRFDFDVAIIGAGFSGSLLAIQLSQSASPPSVALIERSGVFGPGLAYGAASAEHLLNVPAGKMSAFPDKPSHFLDWARLTLEDYTLSPGAFFPRLLYGRYLSTLLEESVTSGNGPLLLHAEVSDIEPVSGGYRVQFDDGDHIHVEQVILAWGNLPPTSPAHPPTAQESRFIRNPWSIEAKEALKNPGDILIIGSGLTCLDLLATAGKLQRAGQIHVLSRHGLFPQVHRPASARERFLDPDNLPTDILTLFRMIREEVDEAEATGSDWRVVIDSIRPFTQTLWQKLPPKEKKRFLRHLRSLWDTLRHRAAPEMRKAKDSFEQSGQLVRHKGRLERIEYLPDCLEASYRPRGSNEITTIRVQAIINATGPEADPRRSDYPLPGNLLARNLIRPDPLGLGIETTTDSSPTCDPIHTVGSLRRGALWESTAVPELRVQAVQLARQIIESRSVIGDHHGQIWTFEI